MSTFQFVALGIGAICVALIAAMFVTLRRAARPRPDPIDELFRDFGLESRLRKRKRGFGRRSSSPAQDFEQWFNEAMAESFARTARARAEFEEYLSRRGTPQQQPVKDWRTALGVGPHATLDEARAAFRRIVKATHPESAGKNANPARLQEAVEAYDAAQRELKR